MRVSSNESYINSAIVGVVIVSFYLWLLFSPDNSAWSVTDIALTFLPIPAALFGGYLALQGINRKKHNIHEPSQVNRPK